MFERKNDNEDEVFEEVADDRGMDDVELEDAEAMGAGRMKALREKLRVCESEKMDALEMLQRTKADFLNSKRRLEEQLESDRRRITTKHIETLLPLCDSFDMAMQDTDAWNAHDETWRKGIEGIHTQLQNILRSYNVTAVGDDNVPFDPRLHEAVGSEPAPEPTKVDTVLRVLQKGYQMGDEVIRPARVIVGTE